MVRLFTAGIGLMNHRGSGILRALRMLGGDRRGSNAVEYALLAAMVAITAIAGILAFADSSVTMWTDLSAIIVDALN